MASKLLTLAVLSALLLFAAASSVSAQYTTPNPTPKELDGVNPLDPTHLNTVQVLPKTLAGFGLQESSSQFVALTSHQEPSVGPHIYGIGAWNVVPALDCQTTGATWQVGFARNSDGDGWTMLSTPASVVAAEQTGGQCVFTPASHAFSRITMPAGNILLVKITTSEGQTITSPTGGQLLSAAAGHGFPTPNFGTLALLSSGLALLAIVQVRRKA